MTSDEQVRLWCDGKSVHNDELGECCPDFSCCSDKINTPFEERRLFRDRPELRYQMLMTFLQRALEALEAHVIDPEARTIRDELQ